MTDLIHFYTFRDGEMIAPCGAQGVRALSSYPGMVTCPACRTAIQPAQHAQPERYSQGERRELRDAGRRHWNA